MTSTYKQSYAGSLSLTKFIKYFSYMFIWPGIKALKLVFVAILSLPFIFILSILRKNFEKESMLELCYWLSMCVLFIFGLCLISFVDPRHYRYGIAIFSFFVIFSIDFIFRYCFGIKNKFIIAVILFVFALSGFKMIFLQGGSMKMPSFEDNLQVVSNKLKFEDIKDRYYNNNSIALKGFLANNQKALMSAWDTGKGGATEFSLYLLPDRPQVDLWNTTVVKWDSYSDKRLIERDLLEYGIKWVMRVENEELVFIPVNEFAEKMANYNRFPKVKVYNYGFPEELAKTNYKINN